jgi:hypothetical protein
LKSQPELTAEMDWWTKMLSRKDERFVLMAGAKQPLIRNYAHEEGVEACALKQRMMKKWKWKSEK